MFLRLLSNVALRIYFSEMNEPGAAKSFSETDAVDKVRSKGTTVRLLFVKSSTAQLLRIPSSFFVRNWSLL